MKKGTVRVEKDGSLEEGYIRYCRGQEYNNARSVSIPYAIADALGIMAGDKLRIRLCGSYAVINKEEENTNEDVRKSEEIS